MLNVFASVQEELAIPNATLYAGDFSFKTIWVGGAGNIDISRDGGKSFTAYTNVPVGWFNVGIGKTTQIMASTTATGLVLGKWDA